MTNNEQSTIVVIGDSDLTTILRLAGLGRYYTIEKTETIESDVRTTLRNQINDPETSIIAIQSDLAEYARDMILEVAEDKNLFPVIIEVPSRTGLESDDASAYYRAFVRKFVGFDIEI